MTNEPIIDARFKKFVDAYDLGRETEDKAFEIFANYSILYQHQPDAFSSDTELMEDICVGGYGDGGLDGIAIKVNGILINSKTDIDQLAKAENLNIEFIFIQSKNKSSFTNGEILKFLDGIETFFSENSNSFNEKVKKWFELKDYIYSTDIVCQWNSSPTIRFYYIAMGVWNEDEHKKEIVERIRKRFVCEKKCSEFFAHFLDKNSFKEILDRNENKFSVEISTMDTMGLQAVDKVEDACIALIKANDFLKLLDTKEGIIRKSLFNDNVRDFQGTNAINSEIASTIVNNPDEFILLNNGITIVCSKFIQTNRNVRLDNPQIVNGCQTCNVLYHSYKENTCEIDKVSLVVKIISTKDSDIANEIVKGTNRQNIVLEEAFEGIKKFHKDLESFVNSYVSDFPEKIYYERRAKQYHNNPTIKPIQRVTLKTLTQFYIGVVLRQPNLSHLHESVLLEKFKDRIFNEKDSKLPYFAVMYAFFTLEQFMRDGILPKFYKKYKSHLLMIYFKLVAGNCPSMSKENKVDTYAEKILKSLYNLDRPKSLFEEARKLFDECNIIWINELHKSKYAMKDIPEFTELLIDKLDNIPLGQLKQKLLKQEKRIHGIVTYVNYNQKFGFIQTEDNEKVFFSTNKNRNLKIYNLRGKRVTFTYSSYDVKNRLQALKIDIEN